MRCPSPRALLLAPQLAGLVSVFLVFLATSVAPAQPLPRGTEDRFFVSSQLAPGLLASSLLASSLLGSAGEEVVADTAMGPGNSVYVVGWTESSSFPTTPGAFDGTLGGQRDAFVARLSADLTTLLAATYLGGGSGGGAVGSWDAAYGLTVASDGIFVTGFTYTEDFPVTPGAFDVDNVQGGATAFVAKLSFELDAVEYATYLGESDTEYGYDIALDPSGDVYVTGFTVGPNFPTTSGAYDTLGGPFQDVFVSRLTRDLSTLVVSTLVPNGIGTELAIDPTGDVFVSGFTTSPDYPTTPGAFDRLCGTDGNCNSGTFETHSDSFVSRLDSELAFLEASTYLGHDKDDEARAIALDGLGGIYVSGTSASSAFPTTPGAFQTSSNGFNVAFVSRLDVDLSTLQVSTLLGGFQPLRGTEGHGMVIDQDHVYVTGETFAEDFPTTREAFDNHLDGANETILSVFDRDVATLTFSSLLGGDAGPWPEEDRGRALALSEDGTIYVSGHTISPNFPTTMGSFQERPAGDFDGFVSWIDPRVGETDLAITLTPIDPPIVIPPAGSMFSYTVVITNLSTVPQSLDFWREIESPGGGSHELAPRALTLAASSSLTRTLSQRIPGSAPAGVYSLTGLVGTYPVSEATDSFSFEKSAGGGGAE